MLVVAGRGAGIGLRARAAVASAMRRLYGRGLVNLRGGNVSVKVTLPDGTVFVYITPSGGAKDSLGLMDVAVMGLDGSVLWGRPSSEHRLHLEIYRRRGDVYAVAHAHNPLLATTTELGVDLDPGLLGVEAQYYLGGCLGRVPALPPGSPELARAAGEALAAGCNAAVMEGHGAVAVGSGGGDPEAALVEAVDRLEVLEDLARAALASTVLKRE